MWIDKIIIAILIIIILWILPLPYNYVNETFDGKPQKLLELKSFIIIITQVSLTLDYKILEKKFLYIMSTNLLEFIAAKFNLNLAFIQLIKTENLIFYIMSWNTEFMQCLDQIYGYVHTKMPQSFDKNNLL